MNGVTISTRSALISTAGHCSVACGFCFRADRRHGFLALDTYTRGLSRLKELGVEGVCLTGGEPAHHPRLRDLVRVARQFGMGVSIVTSARTRQEIEHVGGVVRQLESITISADTAGAMALGGTRRDVFGAAGALKIWGAAAWHPIIHLTYWKVADEECATIARIVKDAAATLQATPVLLDQVGRDRAGLTLTEYLNQQQQDAETLGRHCPPTTAASRHLWEIRQLYEREDAGTLCRAGARAYLSAGGQLRRCPYGQTGPPVWAARQQIHTYFSSPVQDRTRIDCAAICREITDD